MQMRAIRLFMLSEAASFFTASLVHSGVLISGYEHDRARIAETVIAIVLFAGLASSWIRPIWTRKTGLAVQAFALLGTLVGMVMVAIGIGPRTVPDIIYHVAIATVLVWGLVVAKRAPST